MKILPSIEIQHGNVVRLRDGDIERVIVYGDSPAATAQRYADAGLTTVHVVDLDGARAGIVKNWKAIEELLQVKGVSFYVGGGARSKADIDRLLELGADRVILGSIALTLPNLVKAWIQSVGARRIAIAVDVRNDRIAASGWMEEFEKSPNLFLVEMSGFGATTFICTDVQRDASGEGPNIAWYKELQKFFPRAELIASGGIRDLHDLDALAELGIAGTVIGKALDEGVIRLEELERWEAR